MKKIVVILTVLALCLGMFVGCKGRSADSGSKAAAIKTISNSFVKCAADLQSATSGKDAAKILVSFVSAMKTLKAQYPNLKGNDPALKEAGKKFMTALMTVGMKYAMDKDFKEALKSMKDLK